MNKVVWRFTKLSIVLILAYIITVEVLYKFSQGSSSAPFVLKTSQSADGRHVAKHIEPRELPVQLPATQAVAKQTPRVEQSEYSAARSYITTLLMKPQQKSNFYHSISPDIWPSSGDTKDDRIVSQMTYGLSPEQVSAGRSKQILVYSGARDGMKSGKQSFISQQCPVTSCQLTFDRSAATTADIILWQDHISIPPVQRPPGQIWMIFMLESPYHTPSLTHLKNQVNWTATYRRDSTIVAPYERFTLFNSSVDQLPLAKNYAKGKTKKVAWFVSNCGARNNRLGYANELAKHIQVDIYGACGSMSCPRTSKDCFNMLTTTYKFYLAFENSNCKDYITEKFFVNGLQNDVLPIVMGAHPNDYKNAAPKNSYIHVDEFDSPAKLAEYLHELDKDDDKYNEYFRWKGTGDNINTYFWCRLCSMAHAADTLTTTQVYNNIEEWWRGSAICKNLGDNALWPRW